ncbi:hypothetical protein B0I72DRAFT_133009 [Yarrowia lipolytica]|jgi:hypothetical protein|uniref:Alpha/Beta hydrolase protein n=1 Tax=Yarrowia lipolytica TaxID=4952 RepID=A0A1D8NJA1_YARLL|nr:hypothetical protein YALI1_E24360g [Yarrowia lipolytica]KAB8286067.1 hypothetical protein BKA91DRAFT_132639 [Yarrowia lipolytica]KAE8171623.1 hypothetical protein BKA90DRAFT_138642 [Yarrowia lipolytica]KAJ8057162.1 hypothetical protein LXG23DRAFT_53865 [Yarrowia lipolytica]QNQ00044.1 Hypothetical protein YALI2_E01359g [Yarrowia lipolytica]
MDEAFHLQPHTHVSSKKVVDVGGIRTMVYGLEELPKRCKAVGVLYLAHPRLQNYMYTEYLAHELLSRCREAAVDRSPEADQRDLPATNTGIEALKASRPHVTRTDSHTSRRHSYTPWTNYIAVTFDLRNHGSRTLTAQRSLDWEAGNDTHAVDMMSIIDGSTDDLLLVMQYLPAVLDAQLRNVAPKWYNIVSGVSLGGHIAWRSVARNKDQDIFAIAPIIGSPSMRTLFEDRLDQHRQKTGSLKNTNPQCQYLIPEPLKDIIARDDARVFDMSTDTHVFIATGEDDALVKDSYSHEWIEHFKKNGGSPEYVCQEGVGHVCTNYMVTRLAEWIVRITSG